LVAGLVVEETAKCYMDLCSAPGGKATGIAELCGDKVPVLAFDIYESKLKQIRENKNRLGIKSIKPLLHDAKILMPELKGTANVLLDAPCSGLGIIRKKPEIKYTKGQKELNSLVELQRELLLVAKEYVSENGLLVYSTCTLNKKENEENARWFLKENKDFEAYPIELGDEENLIYTEEGFVTILPGHTMDGFFMARFRKIESK
ncbi:MAG: 16S rRNA (cytosine(967)-C(5))-methyltransferase RsmB, partial [Clostridiaceae bacterium]